MLWSGTAVIVRGAVRAPVIESGKGAETALESATGERGHVESRVCLPGDLRLKSILLIVEGV